jgi:hypothetical protein
MNHECMILENATKWPGVEQYVVVLTNDHQTVLEQQDKLLQHSLKLASCSQGNRLNSTLYTINLNTHKLLSFTKKINNAKLVIFPCLLFFIISLFLCPPSPLDL